MKLKDLPKLDRPREKLCSIGVANLSTSELLAIILRSGTTDKAATEIAFDILTTVGKTTNLENITLEQLCQIKGIGLAKATNILASIELGRRIFLGKIENPICLDTPYKIFQYSQYFFHGKKQEYFYCLYVDHKRCLIASKLLFKGTLNRSIVHPREVFKEAYILSATAIICVHNHPSGIVYPSQKDIEFTKDLIQIGQIQGIPILDHLIVSEHNYYSFGENNFGSTLKK